MRFISHKWKCLFLYTQDKFKKSILLMMLKTTSTWDCLNTFLNELAQNALWLLSMEYTDIQRCTNSINRTSTKGHTYSHVFKHIWAKSNRSFFNENNFHAFEYFFIPSTRIINRLAIMHFVLDFRSNDDFCINCEHRCSKFLGYLMK